MMKIERLGREAQLPERIANRTHVDDREVNDAVHEILKNVRERGDEALIEYARQFDHAELTPETLRVTGEEVNDAYLSVSPDLVATIHRAVENVRSFHSKQRRQSWMDIQRRVILGQLVLPIENVGIYVPGGTAPLFSSVIMNAIPAQEAGVERIAMTTPAGKDGVVAPILLVAAYECGVREIYKVGGAHAIAALAYGTQSIAKVDKIAGPGNVYVTAAKQQVFGTVGIDMIAGPSEILIVADHSADASFVAADMLSQAEHDPKAAAYLFTDCETLAEEVAKELKKQLARLKRKDIAKQSLENQGGIYVVEDMLEAMRFSNLAAPEHLELCVNDPSGLMGWVRNAGAVFMGHFAPEPLGDYFAGPNHVLPTSGTSRFFSPLSVDDFMKKTSVIRYSKTALNSVSADVIALARAEGLDAHARAVEIRTKSDKSEKR